MAVPRQQDELYKQSLDAVSSWVRSYFDTNSETTQNFLKSVDDCQNCLFMWMFQNNWQV